MRAFIAATATCLAIVGLATAQSAAAAMRRPTNIAAQPLGAALEILAKERDIQIIYRTDVVGDVKSAGAVGKFTPEEALAKLLGGTGLTYWYLNDSTVTIVPATPGAGDGAANTAPPNGKRAATSSSADRNDTTRNETSQGATPQDEKAGRSFWDRFRLAQATTAKDAGASNLTAQGSGGQAVDKESAKLEEVIVTAQKREERLQDVPVPVSVINAENLVAQNQLLLQDYVSKVPGFNLMQEQGGQQILAIRGITTGISNPAVGVSIDDVPFGSTSIQGGGLLLPDIDPDDLAHIEVLRGPQGTLYGASSVGGLIKFVTADPSTTQLSGRLQVGGSTISHGSGIGYNVRGMVNVPLTDTAAIRASAFTREDPGYIDNPFTNTQDINSRRVSGGRIGFLWRPSDIFSLKLSALLQDERDNGSDAVIAGTQGLQLAQFEQNFLPGTGWFHSKTEAFSAIASAKLGRAELVSITGYTRDTHQDSMDFTANFAPIALSTFGVSGTPFHEDGTIRRLTQEIRLTTPVGQKAEWLLGGFYSHELNSYLQTIWAAQPTGELLGLGLNNTFPTELIDYALFTDLTYHFTDRFDVQVGGRENWNRQIFDQYDTGPWTSLFFGGPPPLVSHIRSSEQAATYLLTPRFKISPDLMIYARLASGFRPGGPNFNVGAPPSYKADRTLNYELGIKGNAFDRALSFDASLYYIDWRDLQLFLATLGTPSVPYTGNGSRAKSEGLELSIEARPVRGMTVSMALSWNIAELTEALPPESVAGGGYGLSGDRLPGSARFTGNFSVNQQFPLTNDFIAFVGGALSYTTERLGAFAYSATSIRASLPAYAKLDANIGLQRHEWTARLYVNNIADRVGVIGGGGDSVPSQAYYLITPRTIGLNITRQF